MKTWIVAVGIGVAVLAGAARAPAAEATYADRATLAIDTGFVARAQMACVLGAITVVLEDPATPNHAARVRLAGYVLREPEFIARRLTLLLAAIVPATVDASGAVSTPLTDEQLQALLARNWTVIADALVPGGGA